MSGSRYESLSADQELPAVHPLVDDLLLNEVRAPPGGAPVG
jgi:hypothetical protein